MKPSKAFTAPTSSREENWGMVNLWVHGAYDIRGTCDTRYSMKCPRETGCVRGAHAYLQYSMGSGVSCPVPLVRLQHAGGRCMCMSCIMCMCMCMHVHVHVHVHAQPDAYVTSPYRIL